MPIVHGRGAACCGERARSGWGWDESSFTQTSRWPAAFWPAGCSCSKSGQIVEEGATRRAAAGHPQARIDQAVGGGLPRAAPGWPEPIGQSHSSACAHFPCWYICDLWHRRGEGFWIYGQRDRPQRCLGLQLAPPPLPRWAALAIGWRLLGGGLAGLDPVDLRRNGSGIVQVFALLRGFLLPMGWAVAW